MTAVGQPDPADPGVPVVGDALREQSCEVIGAVAADDQVALEVRWTGTLAVSRGDLPAGHVLRAHIATFIDFRDGKITGQRNHDCYEPLAPAPAA
ncbi:nuclear transport factor 2 family protein [Streptomyces cucumeris]|uniref:nuclear transport factor 2 family protein n=1 Tax=Streptomyces cucumeris TaxID=2962890 RepID=UPI003D75477B